MHLTPAPPPPRSPAPAWRSPAAPPQQQRLSQRQAWMRRSHLGSLALAAPIAPAAPAATSGDGGRRRHPGARALVLDARLGAAAATAATTAAAGACGAWRVLRRRRGDRSARGARPRPQRHPPVWGPARGPRGGASLLAAPRSTPGLASAPRVDLPTSYRRVGIPVSPTFPFSPLAVPPPFVRGTFAF